MLKSDIIENSRDFEKCVVCGTETSYMPSTSLDNRQFYIEGSGQLCEKCYNELYSPGNQVVFPLEFEVK